MEKKLAQKKATHQVKTIVVVVAHPDDETLWTGGTILRHPKCHWFILCLSRGKDTDRAGRFFQALKILKSDGIMGDLDDGPEQEPLDGKEVEKTILSLLPAVPFDLIITHNPTGEYTRHIRHEEVSRAVINLWNSNAIPASELWTFAYEDGEKEYLPQPVTNSTIYLMLPKKTWLRKYSLITETYGFGPGSWEAETTPKAEAFWQFREPRQAKKWLTNGGILI
jgi:LmbE family N-acetylglucosaminyl deacetylase